MNSIWVVVPVGERETYLPNLLNNLTQFYNKIVFVNNSPNYSRYPGVHHVKDFGPLNIYRWWNTGINYAEQYGAEYVAVLNDDTTFNPNFIQTLYRFLVANDLAIVDVENSGNGGGAAWMMDLSYGLRLDERFQWWFGDKELFDRAKAMGKFQRLHVDGFQHMKPNENLASNPQLQTLVQQDEDLYRRINGTP